MEYKPRYKFIVCAVGVDKYTARAEEIRYSKTGGLWERFCDWFWSDDRSSRAAPYLVQGEDDKTRVVWGALYYNSAGVPLLDAHWNTHKITTFATTKEVEDYIDAYLVDMQAQFESDNAAAIKLAADKKFAAEFKEYGHP